MANCDKATRILSTVASDRYGGLSVQKREVLVDQFFHIPKSEKPTSFRGLTKEAIRRFFAELNPCLKDVLADVCHGFPFVLYEEINDNKVGADLVANCVGKQHNIELKFGQETNRNIGNKSMNRIFIMKDGIDFLSVLRTVSARQKDYVDHHPGHSEEDLYDNLGLLLEELSSLFIESYEKGQMQIDHEAMRELLSSTGSVMSSTHSMAPIKVRIDYHKHTRKGIRLIDQPDVGGPWIIGYVGMAERSNRIEILANNRAVSVKFLLNWKNRYSYKGKKYDAKMGLGSSSWNVWIRELN